MKDDMMSINRFVYCGAGAERSFLKKRQEFSGEDEIPRARRADSYLMEKQSSKILAKVAGRVLSASAITPRDHGGEMQCFSVETFIAVGDAPMVAKQILMRISELCQSVTISGSVSYLEFSEGRAIIKPVGDGLLFWVEASDLLISYGIRAVLQGAVFIIAPESGKSVRWCSANSMPFNVTRIRSSATEEM